MYKEPDEERINKETERKESEVMGTSIRIEAFKGESTKEEVWEEFVTEFHAAYDDAIEDEDCISSGTVHCPYSMANLESVPLTLAQYAGSGILLNLFYLEVEPGETKEL